MENPRPDITHLVLFFLLLCLDRGIAGYDDVCAVEVRIPRHTIISAVKNSPVTLHCPVRHCGGRPQVTWCKLWHVNYCITLNATDNIKVQWKYSETDPSTSTSELIFTRVSMGDAGLYRCGVAGNVTSVSHNINVSVTDQPQGRNESSANTTGERTENDRILGLPHLYIYAGIASLIVIVMLISFLGKRGCQGSNHSTKAEDAGIQYSVILRTHQASSQPSVADQSQSLYANPVRISSNDVHDNHPNRKTSWKKHEASSEAPLTRGSVPGQVAVEMNSSSVHDDTDPNSIVYAALNYRAMGRDQSRVCVQPPLEEHSEYASIRVQ